MTREQQRSVTMSVAGVIAAIGLAVLVRGVLLAWRPAGWMLAGALVALPALSVAYDAFRGKR